MAMTNLAPSVNPNPDKILHLGEPGRQVNSNQTRGNLEAIYGRVFGMHAMKIK